MDIDPTEDESSTQGLALPIDLDPPDEGSLNLGSALAEALNTALSREGSQRTASPVTPEEESPEGTLSPTTPKARTMSTVPGSASAPAPNRLVGLTGDQLAELVAQIATRTEQRPRVQQPSLFEGERTKLRIFLVQLGIYFDALGWNEDQHHKKITYAKSLLRGAAGQWLVPYVEERLEENWETWGLFVETHKLHWGDVDAKGTARNKITGSTQSGGTMTEYANEFRMIAVETEYDEGTLTRLLFISKKIILRPISPHSPCAPDVPGAYNVNSSSRCVRPGSFRPEVKGTPLMRPDATGSVWMHWTWPFCVRLLRPPPPETLPPAPSLFLPSRLKSMFPCFRSADAFQPQPLTSRPPPRHAGPSAFLPWYPLSFNFVTSVSLNPFLTRNSSNITSGSPPPPDSLRLLAYPADVFQSSFFHPISSQRPQPFLLPLIPPCILPYPADVPHPLALSLGSFLSSPHPILFAPLLSPSTPGLLLSARGLPPSSLASNSPPDTFPCLFTHNCPLDYLTKPAQFITIPRHIPMPTEPTIAR